MSEAPKFYRHLLTWKVTPEFDVESMNWSLLGDYDMDYGVIAFEKSDSGYVHCHAYIKTKTPQCFVGSTSFGSPVNCKGVTKEPCRAWSYVTKHGNYQLIGKPSAAKAMDTHSKNWRREHFQTRSLHDLPKAVCDLPIKELKRRQLDHYNKGEMEQFYKYSKAIFDKKKKQ